MSKRIWITWAWQRRNITLSSALNAELFVFNLNSSRWLRYPILTYKTIKLLIKDKPNIIFAQNPSILLAFLVGIARKVSKTITVIDAHNAGLFPLEGKYNLLNKIALKINSMSDLVIVSNDNLREYLNINHILSAAIPDPIPTIKKHKPYSLVENKFVVVFVCSWANDEPYHEVIKAAEMLNDSFVIYITGKIKDKKLLGKSLPSNIVLTGYLSTEKYESLLQSCHIIMVLTTRDNCLVCGAYEAVSVEKPLVLSDTKALREYFNLGSIYTENNAEMIAQSLISAKDSYETLVDSIVELKKNRSSEVNIKIKELNDKLNSLTVR